MDHHFHLLQYQVSTTNSSWMALSSPWAMQAQSHLPSCSWFSQDSWCTSLRSRAANSHPWIATLPSWLAQMLSPRSIALSLLANLWKVSWTARDSLFSWWRTGSGTFLSPVFDHAVQLRSTFARKCSGTWLVHRWRSCSGRLLRLDQADWILHTFLRWIGTAQVSHWQPDNLHRKPHLNIWVSSNYKWVTLFAANDYICSFWTHGRCKSF